ncbi:hypothetical protein CPB83DRAFT_843673, partial [Crepidotus variabilis]
MALQSDLKVRSGVHRFRVEDSVLSAIAGGICYLICTGINAERLPLIRIIFV